MNGLEQRRDRWRGRAAAGLALAALLFFAAIASERRPLSALVGDEGTYLAMATSLARDFDLAFGTADRAWAESRPQGPIPVILQQTDRGLFYSKPILYPLLAAPFAAVAGDQGLPLLNALALAAAFVLGYGFLRRLGPPGAARLTLVTFAGAGAVLPQIAWRMTEGLQFALALAGLTLVFGGLRPARSDSGALARLFDRPAAAWLGALLLGLLASLRDPNLGFVLLAALGPLLAGRPRRAASMVAVGCLAFLAVLAATAAATGATNPYRALRASFGPATGYPVGDGAEKALQAFVDHTATQQLRLSTPFDPQRSLYSALYFAVGRHTGLLIYFPALLALLAAALRRPDRLAGLLLAAALLSAAFYLLFIPDNYFGGEDFLGNRYFLPSIPLLLVALPRLPGALPIAAAWLLAATAALSAWVSVDRYGPDEPSVQNHAYAGLFRLLPYESTGSAIGGRRDRYWSGDFVRFVDPFAEAEPWAFQLTAGKPPAELVVARYWPTPTLSFLVSCDCIDAQLEVSDWRGSRRYPLPSSGAGFSRARIDVTPARPWRQHPFWWEPGNTYRAWVVRLALKAPESGSAARLRYLADGRELALRLGREVLGVELPSSAAAGGRSEVAVVLRNSGELAWTSEAALPVHLGYRLTPLGAGGRGSEGRTPIAGRVEKDGLLTQKVGVDWPSEPGRYRLRVDLVQEDVTWFEDRLGAPIAAAEIEVLAAPAQ